MNNFHNSGACASFFLRHFSENKARPLSETKAGGYFLSHFDDQYAVDHLHVPLVREGRHVLHLLGLGQ